MFSDVELVLSAVTLQVVVEDIVSLGEHTLEVAVIIDGRKIAVEGDNSKDYFMIEFSRFMQTKSIDKVLSI